MLALLSARTWIPSVVQESVCRNSQTTCEINNTLMLPRMVSENKAIVYVDRVKVYVLRD
jgi:hypothetical protein